MLILPIFVVMDKFVPHSIDTAGSYETELMGEVKAGFPSPAEDIREKLDLVKQSDCAQYHIDVPQDIITEEEGILVLIELLKKGGAC